MAKKKELVRINYVQEKLPFLSVNVLLWIFVIVVLIILVIVGKFLVFDNYFEGTYEQIPVCGDGTFYNSCSLNEPFYCEEGFLVEKASICGCPDDLTKYNDWCGSQYQTGSKDISLKYVLRGEENYIDYVVYGGLVDYLSDLPKTIFYEDDEQYFRVDFKLRNLNEENQRALLLPLVVTIQNIAETKEDQVRIATSIVQNIPYNSSYKIITLNNNQSFNLSRVPYEVLYDMQGLCEGKSELLMFLLKEMGYGVVSLYYSEENHEAVGIKCPVEYSVKNSGYCFIETTGPSIISNKEDYYINGGIESRKLSLDPEIFLISEGIFLGEDLYEYEDVEKINKIDNILEKRKFLGKIYHIRLMKLIEKYGLQNYGF